MFVYVYIDIYFLFYSLFNVDQHLPFLIILIDNTITKINECSGISSILVVLVVYTI